VSIAAYSLRCPTLRQDVSRDFFTTPIFENHISSDAVKVARRIADVASLKLRQSLNDAVDRLVGIVFRITQTFGHEDAYQPGANYLVPFTCFFAVGIEPLKQSIKWFSGDGHLSVNSLELGIDKTCAAS